MSIMQTLADEISVDERHLLSTSITVEDTTTNTLKYLPRWPPVNIEFQDLVYTVPDIRGKA